MEKNVNISKEISASSADGEIRQTVLENGLHVITADRPQLETVSLGVWVNTGAANESKADNGISHFIEHMVFKGSKKRNSLQISEDIENVGGRIDGCTSPDFTWFCTQMLKDDLELATDVICDFIANPTFDAAEMEKEKEVVVQEIKRSADAPDRVIFNCLKQAAFPHQPLGQTTLGTPENVRAFNKERLLHYMRRHYTADNMVAVAVGRVDHDSFVKMVRERMSALPEHRDFTEVPQCYIGGSRIECRNMEQTHLALGFEGASLLNPDYYRYLVLSAILGRGTASRLFREVREKRGLVYSVFSSNLAFKPAGRLYNQSRNNSQRAERFAGGRRNGNQKADEQQSQRGRASARQNADQGKPTDVAGKLISGGGNHSAADTAVRTRHPDGGNR